MLGRGGVKGELNGIPSIELLLFWRGPHHPTIVYHISKCPVGIPHILSISLAPPTVTRTARLGYPSLTLKCAVFFTGTGGGTGTGGAEVGAGIGGVAAGADAGAGSRPVRG